MLGLLRRRPRLSIAALIGLSCLCSCRSIQHKPRDESQVRTDIGPTGNSLVAREFDKYVANSGGCIDPGQAGDHLKHVIVSGFGPFQNKPFNISGVVSGTMAQANLWSGNLQSGAFVGNSGAQVSPGLITAADHGGRAVVRPVTVDGRGYLVCFLVLDVKWDLAAAILVHESRRFNPQMIMMMGQGGQGATFEGGAINQATQSNGFDSDGGGMASANIPNVPGAPILTNHPNANGQPHVQRMTWDNSKLRDATKSQVSSMGYTLTAEAGPRFSNDYICNNVSYVVLAALAGEPISLAGGDLALAPVPAVDTVAGFFHIPYAATNQRREVIAWADVVATAVDAQLRE
jgi:pyrrolidone-carboxylate peptidase